MNNKPDLNSSFQGWKWDVIHDGVIMNWDLIHSTIHPTPIIDNTASIQSTSITTISKDNTMQYWDVTADGPILPWNKNN
jgi:hypothetical protein